jgi:hypothetical protein
LVIQQQWINPRFCHFTKIICKISRQRYLKGYKTTPMFDKILSIEIRLRGRYLRFSADIERLLTRNIILCHEEKVALTGSDEHLDIKFLMFHQKIDKLNDLLMELHPDLRQLHSDLFVHLNEFKKMRYKMAHCHFSWNEKDLERVSIWELRTKDRIQRFEPILYTLDEIHHSLKESTENIVGDLHQLTAEIGRRLAPKIPHMFVE